MLEGKGGARALELQGAGSPILTEQALPSALAGVLVMCPGEQRTAWVPGMGGQGSWDKDEGRPTGIQLLEWQPRGRNGVGHTRKVTARPWKQHVASPRDVEPTSREFAQTHSFGYSAGIFTNHVTTQIPRCM